MEFNISKQASFIKFLIKLSSRLFKSFVRKPVLKELADKFEYQGSYVPFTLQFSRRKTLTAQVKRDGSVVIKAPIRCKIEYVSSFIYDKADWIVSQKEYFSKLINSNPKREGYLRFLGREYKIETARDIVSKIYFENDEIIISMPVRSEAKAKKMLDQWLMKEAYDIFSHRLEILSKAVEKIGIFYRGKLKIKKMRSRWGSCSRSGDITLSTELLKTPMKCIDYIILHELCHLMEFNHSPRFHSLVARFMPDWKERKKILEECMG